MDKNKFNVVLRDWSWKLTLDLSKLIGFHCLPKYWCLVQALKAKQFVCYSTLSSSLSYLIKILSFVPESIRSLWIFELNTWSFEPGRIPVRAKYFMWKLQDGLKYIVNWNKNKNIVYNYYSFLFILFFKKRNFILIIFSF